MSHAPNSLVRRVRTATAGLALAALATGVVGAGAEAASAGTVGASRSQLRSDVVVSVNKVRMQQGCKPLKVATKLTTSAQRHANDMSVTEFFSHTSANGRSWVKRQRAAGWKQPGGENIARGYDSAGEVMRAWMNSPSHRRNIVNCKFRHIGVGYTAAGQYWVQNFGY
jgi:uncharacterized protein YkwD